MNVVKRFAFSLTVLLTASYAAAQDVSTLNPVARTYGVLGFSCQAPKGDGWREVGSGPDYVQLIYAEQLGPETPQHPSDKGRALFHRAQCVCLGFRDGGPRALRRLQGPAQPRDIGAVDERQVELVAHHPALTELRLVREREFTREARRRGIP